MKFRREKFGIKFNYLYEILATSFSYNTSEDSLIPNTASMGIRLIKDNHFLIKPYPKTHTFKNLIKTRVITLNFVGDVYLYALASLKDEKSSRISNKFPLEYYKYKNLYRYNELRQLFRNISPFKTYNKIPYVKQAWGIVICKVVDEKKRVKKNELGEISLIEFELETIFQDKISDSFGLFNRAENLALEMVILATRLKVANIKNNQESSSEIYSQILAYKEKLRRFSKNESVNKTVTLIEKYIEIYKI